MLEHPPVGQISSAAIRIEQLVSVAARIEIGGSGGGGRRGDERRRRVGELERTIIIIVVVVVH